MDIATKGGYLYADVFVRPFTMKAYVGVLEILCHSSKIPQKGMTNDSTFRF
ncbi:hypothetical protein XCR1_2860009 [Xenorhabdus cabanillasii JM26]|uniref:Uncharacterized protein n=1 Tax=Xenorhabdus cabanillasii JM26 TaxID=1427517 RepID=W1J665_9GAMM|nr:hypothetical protein XCR1_2860009 [Xenorhabdus cabanillasii JM26]